MVTLSRCPAPVQALTKALTSLRAACAPCLDYTQAEHDCWLPALVYVLLTISW